MGDPKKHSKKYSTPIKAWEKERIDEESALIKEYHFKNKEEIWKLTSKLRNFARQAKRLIALKTEQAEKEKLQLLNRLKSLGMISETGNLDDVLGLTSRDIFDRRLQSVVFKKGLAKSMKQARQFIVHEHILVEGKKITSPNFLVPIAKEAMVGFSSNSALADEMHPERVQEEKTPEKPAEKEDAKKSEDKKEESKKEEKVVKDAKKDSKSKTSKKESKSKADKKESKEDSTKEKSAEKKEKE